MKFIITPIDEEKEYQTVSIPLNTGITIKVGEKNIKIDIVENKKHGEI